MTLGAAILIRGFATDSSRQDIRQLTLVPAEILMEGHCSEIVQAAQVANQLPPDLDVGAAKFAKPAPDTISPIQFRERRSREALEDRLVSVLQQYNGSKEADMFGLVGHKEEIDIGVGHGNGQPAARHVAKRKWQNRYLMPAFVTGVCPCHSWSEPHTSFESSIVVVQFGIVELGCLVESQTESQGEIAVKLHGTARIEQGRPELNVMAEVGLVVTDVLCDGLISLACYIEPLEQLMDRMHQHFRIGLGRRCPRRLLEYEPRCHFLGRRLEASVPRSTCA